MTWAALDALAHRLSDEGHLVTQIHFRGDAPAEWQHNDYGATVFGGADVEQIVTSEGRTFVPEQTA